MKTLVLEKPGHLILTETPEWGKLAASDALVRVRRIGVCGTDIHAYNGNQPFFTYPRILGHELGVEVLEVGANSLGITSGMNCSVEPYLNCGECIACRRGKSNCCASLKVLGIQVDGGHRETIQVPIAKLHPSNKLSLDQLALVETLGIGAHAVDRAQLSPGDNVFVIGSGAIGLAVIQFALAAEARVIVMDINPARLEFCEKTLGVHQTLLATNPDIVSALKEFCGGDLPTTVFDATGSPRSMMASFDYPAHGGSLIFVGLFIGDVTFNDPNFHRRELTLMGSRNSRPQDFKRIIRLIEEGKVDTTPWVTHRANLIEAPTVFPEWVKPESGVLKAIIEV